MLICVNRPRLLRGDSCQNQPVEIENEHVKLEVWPQFGGKVASIIDKADNYDLLYEFPAELPEGPRYNRNYGDGWFGGWDECFPAVGKGPYPRHPYDGIQVPDHGELWEEIPAMAVPTSDGITTVWHGLAALVIGSRESCGWKMPRSMRDTRS